MARREAVNISEKNKRVIVDSIRKFIESEDQVYNFPSSLTSDERKWIHNHAPALGLKTRSHGTGDNRQIAVFKKAIVKSPSQINPLTLQELSRIQMADAIRKFPFTQQEEWFLQQESVRDSQNASKIHPSGRIHTGQPLVAPEPAYFTNPTEIESFRQSLPIYEMRDFIIDTIERNQVILITGETGCGKTTQVPQYLLERSYEMNEPVRIVCAEPRRIAALSVSERVAHERHDTLGQTVGYHIRLESKLSPRTMLTFCTNGVVLRTLMGSDRALNNITHIIVDEIHERDKNSDFLLLVLKEKLEQHPNLKLILMSATLNAELWIEYFGNCPIIEIPGHSHEVKYFFLEDVLAFTQYCTPQMKELKRVMSLQESKQVVPESSLFKTPFQEGTSSARRVTPEEMDNAIERAFTNGDQQDFDEIIRLIETDNSVVDHMHSETGITPLVSACVHGNELVAGKLLHLGANAHSKGPNPFEEGSACDWTPIKWAQIYGHTELWDLLNCWMMAHPNSDDVLGDGAETMLTKEEKEVLTVYSHASNDDDVDLDLILALILQVCNTEFRCYPLQARGAILVFLPGYDDILSLRELIMENKRRFSDGGNFVIFTLHSQMQPDDQKRAFRRVPNQCRKIILATNIAETSVTIDDVVYVIDPGKVKEKSYDHHLGMSMLLPVWVSQANAIQRRGRAGRCRPGICYHLFSKVRFANMAPYQEPEVLRMPLHELCLQARLLAPPEVPIATFLGTAPNPPKPIGIKNAISLLKSIDALGNDEELTELGVHLLDLPIEPHLAKMLLYAIVLKCLDPVLTIVSTLTYRDPFIIPSDPGRKKQSYAVKLQLSEGTHSDHFLNLRVFQKWQEARSRNQEYAFCEANFVSASAMDMIFGIRTQIMGQLRASGFVRTRGPGDIGDVNRNSNSWSTVKACLVAGGYPNILRVDKENFKIRGAKENNIRFHPSSIHSTALRDKKNIEQLPCEWFLFEEMTRGGGRSAYAKTCTLVPSVTVALVAGCIRLSDQAVTLHRWDGQDEDVLEMIYANMSKDTEDFASVGYANYKVDEFIEFHTDPHTAALVIDLRKRFSLIFLNKIRNPNQQNKDTHVQTMEDIIIQTIVSLLDNEERNLGLVYAQQVGARPRPMDTDFTPPIGTVNPFRSPRTKSNFVKRNPRYRR